LSTTTTVAVPVATPVVTIRPTTTCTSTSSTTSSPSNFGSSLWGLVKVVGAVAVLIVILAGLFWTIMWAKNSVNSYGSGSDTNAGELVTVSPGSYTTIQINGCNRLDFAPPEMTVVEYLDANGESLPVYKDGQVQYSLITGPGVDDEIGATRNEMRFLRFSSAGSNSEYSFMLYQE